jgi:hypothetical protein
MRIAVAAVVLSLAGCGYVGDPLPPLANIPLRVTDLAAVQRGATVIAQFKVPQLTTEGMKIKDDVSLDLRAGPAGDPFAEAEWAANARQFQPTRTEAGYVRYVLPVGQWPSRDVVIGVRVIGANGKTAGWSNFAVVAVVPPPEQPRDVRAEAVTEGIKITWKAQGSRFRVFRRSGDQPLAMIATADRPEWIDTSVEAGHPYTYLVQTVVKTGEREAESEPSSEITVTPEDRFPPAVPTGLRAVTSTASIELVWDQNSEPDLAGYRIYRAPADGDFERLAETSGGPSFSDRSAERGKVYRYAVSAFDKAGNESKRSEAVEAGLP